MQPGLTSAMVQTANLGEAMMLPVEGSCTRRAAGSPCRARDAWCRDGIGIARQNATQMASLKMMT
jgi:hypothetical protein